MVVAIVLSAARLSGRAHRTLGAAAVLVALVGVLQTVAAMRLPTDVFAGPGKCPAQAALAILGVQTNRVDGALVANAAAAVDVGLRPVADAVLAVPFVQTRRAERAAAIDVGLGPVPDGVGAGGDGR